MGWGERIFLTQQVFPKYILIGCSSPSPAFLKTDFPAFTTVVTKKSLFQRGALKQARAHTHTDVCAGKWWGFPYKAAKGKKRLHGKNSNKILWLGKSTKVTVSSKLCTLHRTFEETDGPGHSVTRFKVMPSDSKGDPCESDCGLLPNEYTQKKTAGMRYIS